MPKFVLRDLDGNPRFVADVCAGDSGPAVDMGAYEFQGTSCDLSNMLALRRRPCQAGRSGETGERPDDPGRHDRAEQHQGPVGQQQGTRRFVQMAQFLRRLAGPPISKRPHV